MNKMNNLQKLLKAFEVLNRYPDTDVIGTTHEYLSASGPVPEGMSEPDREAMKECGFWWNKEFSEWWRDM